ncbi:TPA: hypothetical protein RFC25_005266 [Klebsiella pneumoniae]|nr:hypothetical protein [Klebsiella pneumoniae]
MKSGLAINIPSSFTRVLSDLSFIPDVNENSLTYTGLFGGSLDESLVNHAKDVAGNVVAMVGRSTERLSFNKGFFSFIGPGKDIYSGTGIRVEVKYDNLITAGYPCTLAVAFRSIRKTAKERYRLQYPIMSFFTNPWSETGITQPALSLSATMLDTGQNILATWSGGIQGNVTTDELASLCSVPIDWNTTDEVICAAISREASGRVNLAVKKGSDAILTSTYDFPVQTPPNSPTGPYILFGTSESRTLSSGDILMGQYWHNTALTMLELQQQVALIHLKASARL